MKSVCFTLLLILPFATLQLNGTTPANKKVMTKTGIASKPGLTSKTSVKPTKATRSYYYQYNKSQLPECTSQQACNAIFLRLNFTHQLCRCPVGQGGPCSDSRETFDGHTMELTTRTDYRKAPMTLLKTCQPMSELRACKQPKDWTLLAMQNVRTGKAQYAVICRCPGWASLEGPIAHENPSYADIPGIRVYGMLCWTGNRGSRFQVNEPPPPLPWREVVKMTKAINFS